MSQLIVFISYSRIDEKWKDQLVTPLKVLQKEGLFDIWDDSRIEPAANFSKEIEKAMNEAAAAVLLISNNYLSSDFVIDVEVPSLIERQKQEKIPIYPVILESCPYKKVAWLSELQVLPKDGKPLSSKNKDEIDAQLSSIAEDIADKLNYFKSPLGSKEPLKTGTKNLIWNVPLRRNPNFTGREECLNELAKNLNSGSHAALTQAIHGMGGIGKTQIALEYAYRYSSDYKTIWWLRAEDVKTLAADYVLLASSLNLPEKDAPEEMVVINAVRNWLEHHQNWLLIFDNAVKPEDINDFLPKSSSGHILITSRHQAWEKLCRSLSINTWHRNESVEFLIRLTKDNNASSASIVAEELGDLPLAIEQAAAYMNETRLGFEGYLELYKTRRSELWDKQNPPLGYPDTVGTTWSLAIEKVKEEAPAGTYILNICSYLAPDKIPRSLIENANKYLPEELSILMKDKFAFNDGWIELSHYSLVNAEPESLSVHRLVQVVVRDRLSIEEQKTWSKVALRIINADFPSKGYEEPTAWPKCRLLLSHAKIVAMHAKKLKVAEKDTASLFNKIALYLHRLASYSDARRLHCHALKLRKTKLGKKHPDVAESLNNLALVLQVLEKYSCAESLNRQALDIRETKLGSEHLDVAESLNNLALLLKTRKEYSKAEELYRRALEIREKELGSDHPKVANVQQNLAALLRVQERYNEADPLARKALEIRKNKLGKDHHEYANSLYQLALLRQAQGRDKKAKDHFRDALKILELKLGADHPYTKMVFQKLHNQMDDTT